LSEIKVNAREFDNAAFAKTLLLAAQKVL
jgi:16S rRNA (guanine1516-N2)-methyltransferase